MIKKIIVSLLVMITLFGCSTQNEEVSSVAILLKEEEDSAMLIIMNTDDEVIYSSDIEIPSDVYFGDEAVYYSLNSSDYTSISYSNFKSGTELSGIEGTILYYQEDGCAFTYTNSGISVYKDGEEVNSVIVDVLGATNGIDGNFYMVADNIFYVFDGESGDLIDQETIQSSSFYAIVKLEDEIIYVVNDYGYTQYVDDSFSYTYVYQITFEEIEGARDNYILLVKNDEELVYEVALDEHSILTLTPLYDAELYENVDFEAIYSEWYEEGYEVNYYNLY